MRARTLLAAALAICLGGCPPSRPSSPPSMPPPVAPSQEQETSPPDDVQTSLRATVGLSVTIDGTPAPGITSEQLKTVPPLLVQAERRAWHLLTLLGLSADLHSSVVVARSATGERVTVIEPFEPGRGRTVLVLDERGVSLGRLRHETSLEPLLADPVALEVESKSPAAVMDVTFVVDGEAVATWTPADLDGFPTVEAYNRRGYRLHTWDLGELALRFAGPTGQLVGVAPSLELPATPPPVSPGLRPVLRRNRRGNYRVGWIDGAGHKAEGPAYGRGLFLHFTRRVSGPR